MNINFRQLDGKKNRSIRSKLTQVLTNLITNAGLEKKEIVSISVSTGRYKTDLTDDGLQLRGYSPSEVSLTIRSGHSLFGATLCFKNGGAQKLVEFMREKNEAKTQMSLMTGGVLFMKPAAKPQLRHPHQPRQTAPPPIKTTQPSEKPATFNLNKDNVSLAFMAITEALDAPRKPFEKDEALEWLIAAKIGIPNNRVAGRTITAMMRTKVIKEDSGLYALTDLGEKVFLGAEFPEVPPETRERKVKPPKNDPPQTGQEEGGSQASNPSPTDTVSEAPPEFPQGVEESIQLYLEAQRLEAQAREAHFGAMMLSMQVRAHLTRYLSVDTIDQLGIKVP